MGAVKVARTAAELEACITGGIFAAILHMEGAEAIDEDLNALEVFYQAGLRSLGIVWSRPTIFAHGVPLAFPSSPDTGPGLTDAGKRLVKRCNELGVMLDLSHLNEKGLLGCGGIERRAFGGDSQQCACPVSDFAQLDGPAAGRDQGVGWHGGLELRHGFLARRRRLG